MHELDSVSTLIVAQKKEWAEILTGFETRNRYVVLSDLGNELYYAGEKSSLLLRWFLKSLRPFTIVVTRTDGTPALFLERGFRFFFHKMAVQDAQGRLLGSIERQFSILRRLYKVADAQGMEMCRLFGPILHPWTFEIRERDREVGKITKKWSGLLKEGFTDADRFAVIFPPGKDAKTKAVLLGAVFLMDFVHFEQK